MSEERSYVIGTHDAEIERLGVQHRVWRPSVLEFWRRGGLAERMTVIDAGCGPGHAALELAEIVGPAGKVIALERSRRFLDALETRAHARGLRNIEIVEADLASFDWASLSADLLWCRWVLAFAADPLRIARAMTTAVRPGGALLVQEYYDYGSWHLAPRQAAFEDYVARIIARWRASGGEPDIALALPALFARAGLAIEAVRPVVFAAKMNDIASRWPMGFAREFLPTLEQGGDMTAEEAEAIRQLLDRTEADPDAFVMTPGVLQVRARKLER
ncbi:MAG TPA: methyltransferase domain-containing protein [Rhizomicrobium sp.]